MSGYVNVRDLLPVEGMRVVSVTQHDEVDWLCGMPAFVMLIFENGYTVRIIIDDSDRAWIGVPASSVDS